MPLAPGRGRADSAAIEDIPSSMQPKDPCHEPHPANDLQLQSLSRHRLRLRLSGSRRASHWRLWPAMPLRPAVPLRQRRPLRPVLNRPPAGPDAGGGRAAVAGTPCIRRAARFRRRFRRRIPAMNSFVLAYAGGLVGAVLMDITETLAARAGLSSGVSVALVGRWALGLLRGQWRHADIGRTPARPGETPAGWAFHFLVGGGGVALLYAALLQATGWALPADVLWGGLAFGVATSLLPWLLLLPAFGWGWFGHRGPRGSNALLASLVSHLPYGLGVGAVMASGVGL